ncbi:MAG: hypothetical protein ABH950_10175 [Candidatus Altiarchaeota archaeon]
MVGNSGQKQVFYQERRASNAYLTYAIKKDCVEVGWFPPYHSIPFHSIKSVEKGDKKPEAFLRFNLGLTSDKSSFKDVVVVEKKSGILRFEGFKPRKPDEFLKLLNDAITDYSSN